MNTDTRSQVEGVVEAKVRNRLTGEVKDLGVIARGKPFPFLAVPSESRRRRLWRRLYKR